MRKVFLSFCILASIPALATASISSSAIAVPTVSCSSSGSCCKGDKGSAIESVDGLLLSAGGGCCGGKGGSGSSDA